MLCQFLQGFHIAEADQRIVYADVSPFFSVPLMPERAKTSRLQLLFNVFLRADRMVNGKIAANGDGSLVEEINVNGYERFEKMAEA